jgi:putative transposase
VEGKGKIKEIPRAQRWAHRPGLKSLFSDRVRQDKPARDAAIDRACMEYRYTMAAVAREAGIHCYSTVSKIIKGGKMKTAMSRHDPFSLTPKQRGYRATR